MKRWNIVRNALLAGGVLLAAAWWPGDSSGQAKLPEGPGLSARYPGDSGIGGDPDVLLAENFEEGGLDALGRRWSDISNRDGKVIAFSDDTPPGSSGKRSLQMTATLGENTGGHLYSRLKRPADTVFARFYVKFAADAGYTHHFVHLGGYNPSTPWPQGGAGTRPRGDERMTVGIEPFGEYGGYPPPGIWFFYAYWHEMRISADGNYWGNGLRPAQPAPVPRDRWQCVEIMLKSNSDPGSPDGELALWLDGRLQAHFVRGARRGPWTGEGFRLLEQGGEPFEGFRWRTSNDLKINFFWLLHYVTENAARQNRVANPNPVNRVWFDDIVVSTVYVGPIHRPAVAAVVSAASFDPGPVAPGKIVTLFGSGIGPSNEALLRLNASGMVDTELADTRVLFDGVPAPLIYVHSSQVNAVVPYAVEGKPTALVQVEHKGAKTDPVAVSVAAAAPAIFTLDGSGRGQGAILNEDGSVNSASNPAKRGSVVVLYATGEGSTDPPGVDGKPAVAPLPKPRLPVSVWIGGAGAEVEYAGAAPGMVAGVLQVNVRVPGGIAPGSAVPITLAVGTATSQPGVTLAVS